MFAALLALALASPQPPIDESVTIAEMECHAMVQRGSEVVTTLVPGLHVIERTAREGPFAAPELPPGTSAIMCPRSTIVPAPNDWKVLAAGFVLVLMESHAPPETRRAGILETSEGQFRFRFVRGEMRDGEEPRLQSRLNQLQQSSRQ